jgi:hypothetical protein
MQWVLFESLVVNLSDMSKGSRSFLAGRHLDLIEEDILVDEWVVLAQG